MSDHVVGDIFETKGRDGIDYYCRIFYLTEGKSYACLEWLDEEGSTFDLSIEELDKEMRKLSPEESMRLLLEL